MKKLIIILLFCLLLITTVYGFNTQPELGSNCTYTQHATMFRGERNFTNGIYGRYSNGSIDCFMPGNNHRANKITPSNTHNDVTGVPEYSTVTLIIAVISVGLGITYIRKH